MVVHHLCRFAEWKIEIFNRLGIACVYCKLSNDTNVDTRFHLTECRLERNSQISNAMHVAKPMFPLALKHINYSNKQTFWKWFSMAIELLMRSQNFLFIAHQNKGKKLSKNAHYLSTQQSVYAPDVANECKLPKSNSRTAMKNNKRIELTRTSYLTFDVFCV